MYYFCCVEGCNSVRQDVPLHSFPITIEQRLKKWIQCLGCDKFQHMSVNEFKNQYVCHKHFEKRFITSKNRLTVTAYPNLFTNEEITTGIPSTLSEDTENISQDHAYSRKRHFDHNYSKSLSSPSSVLHNVILNVQEHTTSTADYNELATIRVTHAPESPTLERKASVGVVLESMSIEADDASDEIADATSEPGSDYCLLDILDIEPSNTDEYGSDINDKLASWLNFIATHGLGKDTKELLQKYPTPSNCKNVCAPILNPEIKTATPDYVVKRDRSIEICQKQIAAAITCVGRIISTQILNSGRDTELLKSLLDVSSILCDVQYLQSNARRYNALNSLNKDLKEQLDSTKIDGFLFGQDLAETIKTAKIVSRSKQSRNLNHKPGPRTRRAAPDRPC